MTHLKEGDQAPDFKALNQDGKNIRLSDFRGQKVVLYFYPKDDTPGCTAEACNLRDNYQQLMDQGYKIMGISNDDENSHKKFARKYDLPFDLLADTDKSIVNDYGVYGEKTIFGKKINGIHRTTFIIDEQGKIERIISKVNTKEHTEQILEQE